MAPPSPMPLMPIGYGVKGFPCAAPYVGYFGRARDHVVEEGGRQRLAVLVIGDFLVQRGAESLRDAADHLAFHDHRVHNGAAIMTNDVIEHFDMTCPGIERQRAGMRRVGERAGASSGLINRACLQRRLLANRKPLGMQIGGLADIGERDALIAEIYFAVSEMDDSFGACSKCAPMRVIFSARITHAADTAPPTSSCCARRTCPCRRATANCRRAGR